MSERIPTELAQFELRRWDERGPHHPVEPRLIQSMRDLVDARAEIATLRARIAELEARAPRPHDLRRGLPMTSFTEEQLREIAARVQSAINDFEVEAARAHEDGERSDLWDRVVEVRIDDVRELLASMARAEAAEALLREAQRSLRLFEWLEIPDDIPGDLWTSCHSYSYEMDEDTYARLLAALPEGAIKDRKQELILWLDGHPIKDFRTLKSVVARISAHLATVPQQTRKEARDDG